MNQYVAKIKTRLYERATRDQSWQAFASKSWLRALSIIAFVSSWGVFAILIATTVLPAKKVGTHLEVSGQIWNAIAFYSGYLYGAGILAYLVLRKALMHIATAPRQVLDERELEIRDRAFRLGYLVVRRVGLGVAIAAWFLLSFDVIAPPGYPNVRQWLLSIDSMRLLGFGTSFLYLLVYTAYAFPLVAIAWRQARDIARSENPQPEFKTDGDWVASVKRITRSYRWAMYVVATAALILTPLEIRKIIPKIFPDGWGWIYVAGAILMALYTFWLPAALVRLGWLFKAEQAKNLRAAAITVNIAKWGLPVAYLLAVAGQRIYLQAGVTGSYENNVAYDVSVATGPFLLWAIVLLPAVALVAATVASVKATAEPLETNSN